MFRLFVFAVVAGFTALFLAGCVQKSFTITELGQMTLQERAAIMLEDPQVDDIYAANVSKFSEWFGEEDMYALMRVVEVRADHIIVVTDAAAWQDLSEELFEDLGGDFSITVWDFDEKIVLNLKDLNGYFLDGSILDMRRLTDEEIEQYLVD